MSEIDEARAGAWSLEYNLYAVWLKSLLKGLTAEEILGRVKAHPEYRQVYARLGYEFPDEAFDTGYAPSRSTPPPSHQ